MKHLNSLREHAESFVERGNNRTELRLTEMSPEYTIRMNYTQFKQNLTSYATSDFLLAHVSLYSHLFVRSFVHHLFVLSLIFSFFHSFTRLFIHYFIHYFIHSSFIYKDDSPDVSAHIYQTTRRHFPEKSPPKWRHSSATKTQPSGLILLHPAWLTLLKHNVFTRTPSSTCVCMLFAFYCILSRFCFALIPPSFTLCLYCFVRRFSAFNSIFFLSGISWTNWIEIN
jgi:hypothetical protein